MKKILLLHGALGSKEQFNEIAGLLAESYNVHSFSFSGHGGRELTAEPFTIELFAQEITEYIKNNKLFGINIFGYSMGGYAALYAAFIQTELIGKIITLATKFNWSPEIAASEVKMLDAEKIKAKVPRFALELSERHGADKWEEVLLKTADMMTALGNKLLLTGCVLNEIKNEVLVSVGDSDKMVSLEETISAYRSLPNARLLVLPGTPHPLEQADPQRIVYEIQKFI